ncbi:MAG: NERD domain-containing protein [Kiritimatiellae bacterium]|nr:NERD domain-containing protein [Kiritimatiellia bacterium]
MAQIHGVAGEWARVKGTVVGLWPLFLGLFIAGFAAAVCVAALGFAPADIASPTAGTVLLSVALVLVCFSIVSGVRRTERFFIGARGEERVSGILKNLPDKYHVFNDFVARGVHVDHVVVGPPGVFAVETKYWRGKVTVEEGHVLVDGRLPSRAPLAQVEREAAKVKAELLSKGWDGHVTPVLVFASNTFTAQIAEVDGVVILNSSGMTKSFGTERIVIPPAELDRLVSLMENNA